MDYDWLHLPELLWIQILQQLDVKSLLNASETCTTFNNLLCDSIFSKKFKLRIDLRNDKPLVNVFKRSNRKYRSVKCFQHIEYLDKSFADFEIMLEILNRFSDSIRQIEIRSISFSSYNWNRLLQTLKYIETFDLFFVTVKKTRTGIKKYALKIDSLNMAYLCTRYMDIFDGASVKKVKISGNDYINNISFLLKHEELKSLTTSNNRMFFITDKLKKVKFSLEYLKLFSSSWSNKQYALNFIRTQTKLQKVYLTLYIDQYDILFLKHIINKNPNLKMLYIKIFDCGDSLLNNHLEQIDINLSVTHFGCDCSPRLHEFSEKIYRLFPNNKVKKI